MWKVTLKNLWAKKFRMLSLVVTIMTGVGFMAGTMVLTDTMNRTFDDLFADVNRNVDAYVRAKAAFASDFGTERPRLDSVVVQQVRTVDGVAQVEGNVQGYAQPLDRDGDPIGGTGAPTFGFNWGVVEELNPYRLVEGRAPRTSREVVIDRGVAKRGDFSVGDPIRILFQGPTEEFTISGIATFGRADSAAGSSAVGFTNDTAQRLLGEPGKVDSVSVTAQPGVSQEELRGNIERTLASDRIEVLTGAEITAENQNDIKDGLRFFNILLLIFALVAIFVGMFVIYNTFSILVAQRTREMALLRAIGASGRQVRRSVLAEATVVGIVASLVGLGFGVVVATALKASFAALGIDIPAGGVVVAARTVVVAIVVGLVTTVVSAWFPARKAARIPPIAALRDVAVDRSATSPVRIVVGLIVLVIGAVALVIGLTGSGSTAAATVGVAFVIAILGIAVLGPVIATPVSRLLGAPLPRLRGLTGTIARQNAMRNPRRTSGTALALTIGVALIGFILVMASSIKASIEQQIDQQLRADYVLAPKGFGQGFSPTVAERVAQIPGAEFVSGVRFGQIRIGDSSKFVVGVNPSAVDQLFDVGVTDGDVLALDGDSIAVWRDVADDNGWAVGDTIPVTFATTGERPLRLVAVYENNEAAGNYVIGLPTYEANFVQQLDFRVFVKTAPGTDQDEFRQAVEAVLADYPTAELQDRTEFKRAQAAQIDQVVNIFYVMLFLAIVIALIGIGTTLALSIFERTRELGLLRAVGMSRRQMRASVRWEAVIIALFGTLLGLVVGLTFGAAIVQSLRAQGFTVFRVPFGQILVLTVLAALAGVLASVRPARRAARLDVLQAIATE